MRYDSNSRRLYGSGIFALAILASWQSIASAQVLRQQGGSISPGTSYASGRSIFGSPFANQPFSISGMNGGSLSGNFGSSFGGTSGSGIPGNFGCGNGNLGGLGLVAPGWWGIGWGPARGFWGPGFAVLPPVWWVGGWNTGFVAANPWGNGWGWGPAWGWNEGFFPPVWNNGFAWDWGFLGAMDNIVMMGNSRFGPARPVRQQRAAAGNGIGIPANANGGGLNAVAPKAPFAAVPRPNMPDLVRVNEPRRDAAPAIPPAAVPDRLQTADRLARNGLYAEALKRYEAISEKHREDPAPLIRIAQIHALADRPSEASKAFAEAEKRASDRFSAVLKSTKWADIADSVASSRLRVNLENWSKNPDYPGIEKLKATFSSSEPPAIAQLP